MRVISIVCPLYNKEKYIEQTILSVEQQTISDWELLIVDDGSTDHSYNIAISFAQRDKRIRVISRNDVSPDVKGANVCRNIGLEKATGDYVMFLDADDLLMPYCIKQRGEMIKNYPDKSLYIFNVAYFKENSALPCSKERPTSREIAEYTNTADKQAYFLKRFLKFDLPWHTSGPLWNRKFLLELGGWNRQLQRLQDPELHIRALLSDALLFEYLMGETLYDVLHRIDDERLIFEKGDFFLKQLNAVDLFLDHVAPLIETSNDKGKLKLLQGYLIFIETLSYRYIRDNPEKLAETIEGLDLIYLNVNIQKIRSLVFNVFLSLYRKSLRLYLVRLRIPGLFLFFYKKCVL